MSIIEKIQQAKSVIQEYDDVYKAYALRLRSILSEISKSMASDEITTIENITSFNISGANIEDMRTIINLIEESINCKSRNEFNVRQRERLMNSNKYSPDKPYPYK